MIWRCSANEIPIFQPEEKYFSNHSGPFYSQKDPQNERPCNKPVSLRKGMRSQKEGGTLASSIKHVWCSLLLKIDPVFRVVELSIPLVIKHGNGKIHRLHPFTQVYPIKNIHAVPAFPNPSCSIFCTFPLLGPVLWLIYSITRYVGSISPFCHPHFSQNWIMANGAGKPCENPICHGKNRCFL